MKKSAFISSALVSAFIGISSITSHAEVLSLNSDIQDLLPPEIEISDYPDYEQDFQITDSDLAYICYMAAIGEPECQRFLGYSYFYGHFGVEQSYTEAINWLLKAAGNGDTEAYALLGTCYNYGLGDEPDHVFAALCYEIAAEDGYNDAKNNLGVLYLQGKGVELNKDKAFRLFTEAADEGNCQAQFNLGLCYHDGIGVEKDLHHAIYWFKKAAVQNSASAYKTLGDIYFLGDGVAANPQKAKSYWAKAAELGQTEAEDALRFYFDEDYIAPAGNTKTNHTDDPTFI